MGGGEKGKTYGIGIRRGKRKSKNTSGAEETGDEEG